MRTVSTGQGAALTTAYAVAHLKRSVKPAG